MRYLITGSDGLVGSALKKELENDEAVFINRSDADLTSYTQTLDVFRKIKPSHVIHLAAQVGGIGGNLIHSGEYFRNNLLINLNVLESARIVGCERLISFMSTCVFPDKSPYPLREINLHNGPPHHSNFGYAYAKRMLEVQSTAYRKEWNCDFIVAIPTNIYGPNDNFSITEGHVVPALIHRMWLANKNRNNISVWGSGHPLREFVFSSDIAKLAIWALNNYFSEEPIIFSSEIETSINDLVDIVAKEFKFSGNIVYDTDKPDGQLRKPSDGSKLKKLNNSHVWTDLHVGISETINWFKNNHETLRK